MVQEDLFGELAPEPVLMSLNPEYYELMWHGLKTHEFRRRYLSGRPTTWYVYLTVPVSKLTAVIDLDPAIIDRPQRIADIAERARAGNGASVFDYLKDVERGFALPIRRVREYVGFTATELGELLGSFHPPQGYTLVNKHPTWTRVCDKLVASGVVREMTVSHSAAAS